MRLASGHNSSESLRTSSMQGEAGRAGPVQNGEGSQGLHLAIGILEEKN